MLLLPGRKAASHKIVLTKGDPVAGYMELQVQRYFLPSGRSRRSCRKSGDLHDPKHSLLIEDQRLLNKMLCLVMGEHKDTKPLSLVAVPST